MMNCLLSISNIFSSLLSILLAVLVLLIMITVHEFGHYIVGKLFKFKINEFAIGMGPALFKKKNNKTGEIFSIRAFPLGGYCAFEGEDQDGAESPDAFNNKSPFKRIVVLLAGATMNLIIGVLVLLLSTGIYGQLLLKTHDVYYDNAYSGYSLQKDDVILSINGKNTYMTADVLNSLDGKKKGDVITVLVENEGKKYERSVKLRNDVTVKNLTDTVSAFKAIGIGTLEQIDGVTQTSKFLVGDVILKLNDNEDYNSCTRLYGIDGVITYAKTLPVGSNLSLYVSSNGERKLIDIAILSDLSVLDDTQIKNALGILESSTIVNYSSQNVKFGFFETIKRGFAYSVSVGGTIFRTLGELLTGKLGISAVGGPITTISTTSSAIKAGGFNYFLEIMGFIGINLAVFNLLPIPALDGSRVVFCLIEAIRKKPLNRKVEGIIHTVGLLVLLGFCVLVDFLQMF